MAPWVAVSSAGFQFLSEFHEVLSRDAILGIERDCAREGLDGVLAESERALASPEPGQRPGVVRRLIEDRQVHGDGLGRRELVGRQCLQVADR